MSEDTYNGLTAEQWHNAYQDLKRKHNELDAQYNDLLFLWIMRIVGE